MTSKVIRISGELNLKIESIAKSLNMPKSQVVNMLVNNYLNYLGKSVNLNQHKEGKDVENNLNQKE